MAETGRNDPCTCGSGKKFKRCCLPVHQAQAKPQTDDPIEAERLQAVMEAFQEFACGEAQCARQDQAEALFYDMGGQPDYPEVTHSIFESLFWPWFYHFFRDADGRTAVERYLMDRRGRRLPAEERAILEGLGRERYRLATVESLDGPHWVTFVDEHTGERLSVEEQSLGYMVKPGELHLFFGARVSSHLCMIEWLPLDTSRRDDILAALEGQVADLPSPAADSPRQGVAELLARQPLVALHLITRATLGRVDERAGAGTLDAAPPVGP